MKKPTPRLTREEKAAIALAWLTPLQQPGGKPVAHDQLAADFGARTNRPLSTKAVAQAIRDSFRQGLVSVRQHNVPPSYIRRDDLETKLCARFGKLRFAIVVESEEDPLDNEAHMQVGDGLAREILAHPPFRGGDRIGIGSGRGVYCTVDALLRSAEALPPSQVPAHARPS